MEFFTHTLPNGIRCIHKRIKSPVAYCAMTINSGSRDEEPGEYGMAHFTEHMLFKGTARRKAHHINSRLERLGGELNAFTTKEETVIHSTTLKTDLSKATELISDIVFSSRFPEKELSREKVVVLDEVNSYKDSPSERIYDEFEDMLFSGSQLGHNILGTCKSIKAFTGEGLRNFTGRTYNTDNMVFSVASNCSEKTFIGLVGKYLAPAPVNTRKFDRQEPGVSDKFSKSINRNTHQAHCMGGTAAYGFDHPKRVALSLLTNILGGPAANSKLNMILREKFGLTYGVDSSYIPYSDTGVFSIYLGCDKENIGKCIELVEAELLKMSTHKMKGLQFSMAKKQFTGQLAISMEAQETYMLGAAKSLLIYNEVDSPEAIYRKINAVTASDIMECAEDIVPCLSWLIYK